MLELRQGMMSEYRVFDRDGARYLLADGSIQAVMDTLSGECVQRGPAALELLKIFCTGRESMLVLGLRGGTLPLSFARAGWSVRVVEPDGDAARAARRVAYRPGEMQLFVDDPRLFVRSDPARYSVIVVDALSGSELPSKLCTREFVQSLVPRLWRDGLVVYSVEAHGWGDPLVQALAATLKTRFAHVVALPTSEPQTALGTVLLIASAQPLPLTDEQLPDPTTYFQNPDALWAVQQQLHAWLNRYEPGAAGARVITDDQSRVEVWADRVNHAARKELHTFFGPKGGSW
jgi:spermidine synthase